jgi:hypothetical protein
MNMTSKLYPIISNSNIVIVRKSSNALISKLSLIILLKYIPSIEVKDNATPMTVICVIKIIAISNDLAPRAFNTPIS